MQPWPFQTSVSRRPVASGGVAQRSQRERDGDLLATRSSFEEVPSDNLEIDSATEDAGLSIQQRCSKLFHSILVEPSLTTGRILVMIAAALFGTNFAIVKLVDQNIPTPISAAGRFTLSAIFVFLLNMATERGKCTDPLKEAQLREDRFHASMMGAEVGIWYCVGYIAQALGLHMVEASYSAFFNALAVVVVPILDIVFKGRRIDGQTVGSVMLAIAGVALLQLGPSLLDATMIPGSSGDLLCWAQAIFFGVGYWRLENASTNFPEHDGRIMVGLCSAVSLGTLIYAATPLSGPSMSGAELYEASKEWFVDPFLMGAIFWTGLISTALAIYMETVALKVVSASELTILMTSVSLWGSAVAYFSMGEVLSPIGWVGGLMILSGCVLNAIPLGANEASTANEETAEIIVTDF